MNTESMGTFGLLFILVAVIISILMIIAVREIPKIANYQKATFNQQH